MEEEWLDLYDTDEQVIGRAARSVCHSSPGLMHRAVHVLVFSRSGELYLQKRSDSKDIQPGKWDTSVGGHPGLNEDIETAARREAQEELGIALNSLLPAYSYIWQTERETEWIHAFAVVHEGPFQLDPEEVSDGRFWTFEQMKRSSGSGIFTPQLEQEMHRIFEWSDRVGVTSMIASGTRHGVHPL